MLPHPHQLAPLLLAVAACSSSSSPASPATDAGAPLDAPSHPHPDATPSSDATPSPDAPVDAPAHPHADATASPDATSTPDASHDAAPDAPPFDPVVRIGGCVGSSSVLTVSGQMPYVDVPVGNESGEFVLDFGSTFSSIDLSAFAAPGPTTSGCDASELGSVCTVDGFAFFSTPSAVTLTTEDYADVGGTVRQAGIIGTDFLSEKVITLDYVAGEAYAAPQGTACDASVLATAGFVSLSTAGFYENDLALLEPFTLVDTNAEAGDAVPNVPTVAVRVAGALAVAQLDTGFDDSVTPFSVNINVPFFDAIPSSALVRDASLDETLTTCVDGVNETATAYRLATGTTFDLVTDGGAPSHTYPNAVLFVKSTPADASSCGGIGTWTSPAAQVGASFYVAMKALIFDPFGAKVWVPAP